MEERILSVLLEITLYAALLFGAILLIKTTLGSRLSPALHYALWLLLVARLLLPVTLESGVHLVRLPAQTAAASAQSDAPTVQMLALEPGALQADLPDAALPSDANAATPPAAKPRAALTTVQLHLLVWLCGAATILLYLAALYVRLRMRMKRSAIPAPAPLAALFERTKAELGIRAGVRLCCLDMPGAPALLFPKTLLMPLDALTLMDEEQIALALRHELTHYWRGDQVLCLLLSLLCAVYWFNPVVWLAFPLLRADMETACDSMVTRDMSAAGRSGYAAMLLELFAAPAPRGLSVGMAQRCTRAMAERRIRGVYRSGRSSPAARLFALLAALILLAGCFTTACRPVRETPTAAAGTTTAVPPLPEATAPASPEVEHPDGAADITMLAALSDATAQRVARIDRTEAELFDGVLFETHADVLVPDTDGYRVRRAQRRVFTRSELEAGLAALFPGVDWHLPVQDTDTLPDTDFLRTSTEIDGRPYELACGGFSAEPSTLLQVRRTDTNVYNASYFYNDPEMEEWYGETIRQPITLTAEQARPQADAVLAAFKAQDMLLQGAYRACGYSGGEDETVRTRGWWFVYVPESGDLPVTYRGGRAGYDGIRVDYGEPITGHLSVYVSEEAGLETIFWTGVLQQTELLEEDVSILPYDEVLQRAVETLTDHYREYGPENRLSELEIRGVQLAAAIIGDEPLAEYESVLPSKRGSSGRIVPVWEIVVTGRYSGIYEENFVLRYNALDGGMLPIAQ